MKKYVVVMFEEVAAGMTVKAVVKAAPGTPADAEVGVYEGVVVAKNDGPPAEIKIQYGEEGEIIVLNKDEIASLQRVEEVDETEKASDDQGTAGYEEVVAPVPAPAPVPTVAPAPAAPALASAAKPAEGLNDSFFEEEQEPGSLPEDRVASVWKARLRRFSAAVRGLAHKVRVKAGRAWAAIVEYCRCNGRWFLAVTAASAVLAVIWILFVPTSWFEEVAAPVATVVPSAPVPAPALEGVAGAVRGHEVRLGAVEETVHGHEVRLGAVEEVVRDHGVRLDAVMAPSVPGHVPGTVPPVLAAPVPDSAREAEILAACVKNITHAKIGRSPEAAEQKCREAGILLGF